MIKQRVYAMALGYEDLNDHDSLRHDVVMGLLCIRCSKIAPASCLLISSIVESGLNQTLMQVIQTYSCRSGGMADGPDSKSGGGNPVRVQVQPPAPFDPQVSID
jgi:hypothetical protein